MTFNHDNLFKLRIYTNHFCNLIFQLGIISSSLIFIFASYKIYNSYLISSNLIYYIFILTSICLIVFFSFYKHFSLLIKVNTVLIIIFTIFPIYIFEINYERINSNGYAAKKLNIPFDSRSDYEFYLDLKKKYSKSNISVFPNFRSRDLFHEYINKENDQILPLGGLSNSITYFTNEAGFFPIIHTDKYGFANMDNKLYEVNNLDILLVGDSGTEGYSVLQNENYAGLLNKRNYSTISLGKSGSGSLIQFASLVEYGNFLKPKYVLWMYYDNDIQDLEKELQIDILKKYLSEDNFNQDLINRQPEIDSRIKNFFDKIGVNKQSWLKKFLAKYESEIKILKLVNTRGYLGLNANFNLELAMGDYSKNDDLLNEFKKILFKANDLVSGWGGKLYFVYLPDVDSLIKGEEFKAKKQILNIATDLKLSVIDIDNLVFQNYKDPLDIFPLRRRAHYNAQAYDRIVAELVQILR